MKLMRYYIGCGGYRDILKGQSNPTIDSLTYKLNFFELVMNKTYLEKKQEYINKIYEIYDLGRIPASIKQITLGYQIQLFDSISKKQMNSLAEYDIRRSNYEILNNPDNLVREFVNFINETIDLAVEFGF